MVRTTLISIKGRDYVGWQEAFIRTCLAMTREGIHSREFVPNGQISVKEGVLCPNCKSDCYFVGEDLEFGELDKKGQACFCGNCEEFTSNEWSIYRHPPQKVLQIMKRNFVASPPRYKADVQSFDKSTLSSSEVCPICGAAVYTYHIDLGGIDYYDNYWTMCMNQFCDWQGDHREEVEPGPYASGPTAPNVYYSDIRRFQTVFISYSTNDEEFANAIYYKLKSNGILCWYAPHNIRGGKTVREQLQSAVRKQERLLLIISESSMNSEWVQYEISEAKHREKKESRKILFPISLIPFHKLKDWVVEDDQTPDLAKEIRKYYIPNFSEWRKKDIFEAELKKLLEALAKE